jgi:hypothetical protein
MSLVMPRRSIAGPVPREYHALGLSFNHLQLSCSILPYQYPLYPYPPPLVGGSSGGTEEEVTRPIGRDRAKTAV